ncbi:hypothetical protein CS063_12210 [Sporanaerobium hydrogeniformans]|uniref:Uncharacterized protein n=1 Tax=Sporanaerobium hydrogeniformans TaxID=3072179 RepID=A0AC61DAM0_9FIRM|nr:hypothetical protein [Sporanaerobium hydrogeniformans]PHV70062.1 hypothetical protein CS063_12210 [Sporanaerobium hydrogeniformans]
MILLLELFTLCIGLTVYILYHCFKQHLGIMTSKILYWCTLLFMSVTINGILSASYPDYFSFEYYTNSNTLWAIGGIVVGSLLLHLMSPTPLKKKKNTSSKAISSQLEDASPCSYLKEMQFETFLEVICWLAFVFTIGLEAYVTLLGHWFLSPLLLLSIKNMGCLMMMATLPLIIRQLVFYIHALRSTKNEQELTKAQLQFYQALNRKKNKL